MAPLSLGSTPNLQFFPFLMYQFRVNAAVPQPPDLMRGSVGPTTELEESRYQSPWVPGGWTVLDKHKLCN